MARKEVQASLLRRLFAFILDLLIINLIIVAPFRHIMLKLIPENASMIGAMSALQDQETLMVLQMVFMLIGILGFCYFILLEYAIGQTVGKIILNLEVKGDGSRPGIFRIMLRNLFLIPVFPFSLIWIFDLGYLLIFSGQGQRLTEYWSKTRIIKVE